MRQTSSAYAAELLAVYWAFAALCAAGLLIQHRWPVYALGLTVAGAVGHALIRDWNGAQITYPTLIEHAVPITLYAVRGINRLRELLTAIFPPWSGRSTTPPAAH